MEAPAPTGEPARKPMQFDLNADRADFTDPHRHKPMADRLREAHVVDLRDNYWVEDLGGGYGRIHAIDPGKTY